MQPRQTAYKLWIGDVVGSPFTKSGGEFEPSFITFRGMRMSRVNVIATVTEVFDGEGSFSSFVLDDGSGTVSVRAFDEGKSLMKHVDMGDVALVVGKVKQYNDEIYVVPEVVKRLDTLWG